MLPRLNLLIKRQNSRNGKVGQPLAAVLLYGCCIPLAGKECARDYARRRVSERNRRKAALSAEITQEGIHRRLKPNSESYVSSVNASFVTFCSPMRSISALSISPVASSASEPAVR